MTTQNKDKKQNFSKNKAKRADTVYNYNTYLKKQDENDSDNSEIQNEIIEDNYKIVEKTRKNIYNNNIDNLQKQIEIVFSNEIYLTDSNKYSKENRNCHNVINLDKDGQIQKMMVDFEKKFNLKKEVEQEVNKQRNDLNNEKRMEIVRIWKKCIITAAVHFKRLNLSLSEVNNYNNYIIIILVF
jgi:hypothetical protein